MRPGGPSATGLRSPSPTRGSPRPPYFEAPERTGYVNVDGANGLECFACVFYADDFQVHISSEARTAVEALGYQYPGASDHDVYSDILGHELFHNFQNAVVNWDLGGSMPNSYMEGTARMQQTLHRYSGIEHQPTSLLYDDEVGHTAGAFENTCNGFYGNTFEAELAAGPFEVPEYTVRDPGSGLAALSYPAAGELVAGAEAGETVYVVATWPRTGSRPVTLALLPG